MLASYHNHTTRCKHATGTPEEYLLRAIEAGYSAFGFSCHAPICDGTALSDARMSPGELPDYVSDIRALRDKYGHLIDVHIGLELEYLPMYHKDHMKLYREAGVEYLILGQHYNAPSDIKDQICSFAKYDNNSEYKLYVDLCTEALSTGDFAYFAHPDVFRFCGDPDFYLQESERLILCAIKNTIPLEVNMYGLVDNRHYPRDSFWELAGKLGAPVVLGRDAHKVERVHPIDEFPRAYAFIEKHGLNLIETPNLLNGKRII